MSRLAPSPTTPGTARSATTPANYSFYNSEITALGYAGSKVTAGEELLCDRVRAEPVPLLDIGCGSGRLHTRLSRRARDVVGLDYAPEQLRLHHRQFPGSRLVQGSATQLPFADRSFRTAVMSYHVIESILPSRARAHALADAARVLTDGGSLFLTRHVRRNYQLRDQVVGFALRRVVEFGDLTGPARPMGARKPPEAFTMHVLSGREMRRTAASAGLRRTEAWDFDTGDPVHRGSRAVVERYVR